MRYRALDPNGDSTFGLSLFFINDAQAVGQAVLTRLKLAAGEWFLDVTVGTPYSRQILGRGTTSIYDLAIRTRILQTQGVISIVSYSSSLDRGTRMLMVNAQVQTLYGQITIDTTLPFVTER